MKRMLALFFFALATLATAQAQKGLHTNALFEGQIVPRERMVETFVKGRKLAPYRLSTFRSLRLPVSDAELLRIERLVRTDAATARDKETELHGGRLIYALLRLVPQGETQRYLCFQRTSQGAVTVVYLEGTATLQELKNMFKK